MTTYNGEKFVKEQLKSFLNQTKQPDELIIVDDCSTDRTIDILEKFKYDAPFDVQIYINEINLGYTQNFNRVLELCTGDFIFLSDQDDVWFPTKIDYMVNLSIKYPNKALYMIDAILTDENLEESEFTKIGQIKDLGLSEESFVMGCCIAIEKDFLNAILPIPKFFKDGHDVWLVSIADVLKLRYVSYNIQQYYRIHNNNTSSFIANNLCKMKKIDNSKSSLKKSIIAWIHSSKMIVFQNYIDKNKIIVNRLEKLLEVEKYASVSKEKLIKLKYQINLYEKRLEIIKSKNSLDRIINAFKFYKGGGYNSFYGIKTCLSDIMRS